MNDDIILITIKYIASKDMYYKFRKTLINKYIKEKKMLTQKRL